MKVEDPNYLIIPKEMLSLCSMKDLFLRSLVNFKAKIKI